MSDQHTMLVVEDDAENAAVFREMCVSLGYQVRHAVTLADVRAAIAEGGFCGVILDLQIPADEHTRAHVASGETALALLRKRDRRRNAEGHHCLPIIAITGYSAVHDFVARLFKAGVDEFIPKSFDDGSGRSFAERLEGVRDKIRTCFVEAGRDDHAACAALDADLPSPHAAAPKGVSVERPDAAGRVVIELTGELADQRTVVLVNGTRCTLQGRWFSVLLHLALEHERDPGAWLTHHELGIAKTPEVPKRLRDALKPGLADVEAIETRYGGHCRLAPAVTVKLDERALARHPDERVKTLLQGRRR